MTYKKVLISAAWIAGMVLHGELGVAKSAGPRWASSTSFPQNPLAAFSGITFTGSTTLTAKTFSKPVLSRGPMSATGCVFTLVTIQGPFAGTNVIADQVVVQGPGYMIGGTIKEAVTVQGQMALRDMTILGSARFSGQAVFENVTVNGLLTGKGELVAKSSTLNDVAVKGNIKASDSSIESIETAGAQHSFENCTLSDVTVNSTRRAASIYLRSTTVKGKIRFEGGKGTVYTDRPSDLIQKVVGGTVKSF